MLKNKKQYVKNLISTYKDLEITLIELKKIYKEKISNDKNLQNINLKKLILQLSASKKRLERKIYNTLLLEKQHFKEKLLHITDQIHKKIEKDF
jgi:hypothetical protein